MGGLEGKECKGSFVRDGRGYDVGLELCEALKNLKQHNKASGPDGIPADFLKCYSDVKGCTDGGKKRAANYGTTVRG